MSAGIVDTRDTPLAKNSDMDAMRARHRADRMAIEERRRQDMYKAADHEIPPRGERHLAAASRDAGFGRTPTMRRTAA